MPKIIELTFELNINKVSCPGVWLCQDGMVSLTVFALGSSYQTGLVPPIFPLMYKDVFYFRKRFQASCTLSNIFCLLKDETVYCELIQWCGNCNGGKCMVLAQYLGALNDVLFPPNLCSSEGVDLLMRRSKGFPGILAPKIEITTKVRIDEVYDQLGSVPTSRPPRIKPCSCRKADMDPSRQKQVCHTPLFHRCRHSQAKRPHSAGTCSSGPKEPDPMCNPPLAPCKSRSRTSLASKHKERCREYHQYHVYNVAPPKFENSWQNAATDTSGVEGREGSEVDCDFRTSQETVCEKPSHAQKHILESRFIEPDACHQEPLRVSKKHSQSGAKKVPCVCDICKRYYELFHANDTVS